MTHQLDSLFNLSHKQKDILRHYRLSQIKKEIESNNPNKHIIPTTIPHQDIQELYDLFELNEYTTPSDLLFIQVEVSGIVLNT